MSKEDEIKKLKEDLEREKQERKLSDLAHDLSIGVLEQNQTGIERRFNAWADALDELHKAYGTGLQRFNQKLKDYQSALEADRQLQAAVLGFVVGAGIGWVGMLTKNALATATGLQGKVQEQLLGNVEEATKAIVDAKLKSLFESNTDKDKVDKSVFTRLDPVTILRDIAQHVRHVKIALRQSIAEIAKHPEKHLPLPPQTSKIPSTREEWLRLWLEVHNWDYAAAKNRVANLLQAKVETLVNEQLKTDPKPPSQDEMASRIEKTLWAYWIAEKYEKELADGPFVRRFVRLDALLVSAGVLNADKPPTIYRGEQIDSAYSPFGKWYRRRRRELWQWAANWVSSEQSKIPFISQKKDTVSNQQFIQRGLAHSAATSLALRQHMNSRDQFPVHG